jgi:hypothetical protein
MKHYHVIYHHIHVLTIADDPQMYISNLASSDGLFMDELESITMTTSLYLGNTVAANSDL